MAKCRVLCLSLSEEGSDFGLGDFGAIGNDRPDPFLIAKDTI
jgi:hypothetical protein